MIKGYACTKEMVLDELKKGESSGMSALELAAILDFSHETIRRRLLELIEDGLVDRDEKDTTEGKRRFLYRIVEEKPEQKEEPKPEKPERYGDNKNDEGYPDPTFAKALKSLDRFGGIMPGGLYRITLGGRDSFLVVRTYPDCALGYYVQEVQEAKSTDTTTAWQTKKGTSYVHVNQLMSVPFRKLDKHKFERMPLDAYKDIIRKSPLQAAKVIPVEVEKEVIKEVPAELTIEGCYEYLRDSGWLDEHDKAVKDMEAAKLIFGAPTELTNDICIEFLQNSGWLPEHDKALSVPEKPVKGRVNLDELPSPTWDEVERNLLIQKVEIYENIIKVLLPGWKK